MDYKCTVRVYGGEAEGRICGAPAVWSNRNHYFCDTHKNRAYEQLQEGWTRIMTDKRTSEVLVGTIWKSIDFKDIKKGNFFRLFEPDGKQVFGDGLSYMYEATGEPYVGDNGVYEVMCVPVDPIERGLEIEEYVVG